MTSILHHGDCIAYLKTLEPESISAVVTDPPYHLQSIQKRFGKENSAPAKHGTDGAFARSSKGFMGKAWDGGDIAFRVDVWAECLRVLKPGGYLLAFGGTRTYHRLACAIEDAGFEIRDMLEWVYGSGLPKSHNVSLAIDKSKGKKREVIGKKNKTGGGRSNPNQNDGYKRPWMESDPDRVWNVTLPVSDEAKIYDGYGTNLKPCHEPIAVARKPVVGTVGENIIQHRVGALNIDASRVDRNPRTTHKGGNKRTTDSDGFGFKQHHDAWPGNEKGFPSNLIHDGSPEVLRLLPDGTDSFFKSCPFEESDFEWFMYCAKPGGKEKGKGNGHPTVKPKSLLKYLVNMVTPPGGKIIDPFMGTNRLDSPSPTAGG